MNITILLFTAILPIILILVYVYSKDKDKEPIILLLQLFCLGILSCFITLLISRLLDTSFGFIETGRENNELFSIFIYSFVKIALIEELCKWIMVYIRGYNNKEFDDKYDIVVYSVFVSLGFAFFENIVYVFYSGQLITAIIRGLLSVPSHTCDAIFMGYFLSIAKNYQLLNDKKNERKNILLSIFIPTLLHGIYDFCIFSKIDILLFAFILFVIGLFILSYKKLQEVSESQISVRKRNKKTFCKYCGAIVQDNRCSRCGKIQ